jgi:hypothetical protein
MAPPYKRSFSFAGFQANQPQKPPPGQRIDIELDDIAQRLNRAGASVYEIAVLNGFTGSEADYLRSLVSTVPGPPGRPGEDSDVTLDSPAFTGTPTVPTPNAGDSSALIASTAFFANGVKRFRSVVFLENFGGGAGVDNSAALMNASAFCAMTCGGVIQLKDGVRYAFNSAVTLGRNVILRGATPFSDPGNPFGLTTEFFDYMRRTGALVAGPNGTIALGPGGGLEGVFYVRSNLKLDGTDLPTSFTGTAITAGTQSQNVDGCAVRNCAIVGFDKAFVATYASRLRIENNVFDCNSGCSFTNSADFGRVTGNHFYGITQAGATGHETFSNRSGTAIGLYGSFVAGLYLFGNFTYAYQIGLDAQVPGQITVDQMWIDGTTTTGAEARPLVASTIGMRFAAGAYLEPQFGNVRICGQGTAVVLGLSTAGAYQFVNFILWANAVGWSISANNVQIINMSCRGYDAAIIFNTAAAANTAKIVNPLFFDRNTSPSDPIDINAGGGDPTLVAPSVSGRALDMRNEARTTVSPDGNGLVAVPNGKTSVRVTGTQPITNVSPAYDGSVVTLEFAQSGNAFSGSAFVLSGAFSTTKAGANITLRFNRSLGQWVEIGRGPV